jgi:glycosyltransferase involved in cell wall biosynthesis
MHGSYEGYPRASVKKRREKVFSRVNGIIYLTPKNIEFLKPLNHKNPRLKFQQVYNGYIPQLFPQGAESVSRKELRIPEDSFVFIQVARGTQDKGWQETITAFLMTLKKTQAKINLLLVGNGDFLSELKKRYSIHPEIIFYGYSGNPIPLIELSDAGLLPTYYKGESLPNTVIEYLFSGKPVLASDIGEINNMLGIGTDAPAGYTFNLSANGAVNENELSEKMLEYIVNREIYEKHSANTKIQREKFRMENCVNAYQDFFTKLIGEN